MRGEPRPVYGLIAAVVVASPVVAGIVYAIMGSLGLAGPGAGSASLSHVQVVLRDSATWRGLLWTVWIASASTLFATIFAIGAAAIFRAEKGVDRFARVVAIVPLAVPHVVAALCLLLILGQSGLLARVAFAASLQSSPADMPALTSDRYGIGLIVALVWKEFPFLALVAFSVIAQRGVDFEETARTLGAGTLRTFRVATLPALWRGLLPAMIAVFTFVAGNYEVAVLLAPSSPLALPLLTMERYTDSGLAARGDAFVLVLLATMVSVCGVVAHEWFGNRVEVVK